MNGQKPKLGYIGLGIMGEPMASRLLDAGYSVAVWNRTPEKAKALLAKGASTRTHPAEIVGDCDILFTCVTDASALEHVLFGPGGVAEARGANKTLVDFSTTGPGPTVALAQRLRAKNEMKWVDSPVTGGQGGAKEGTLTLFVGGEADDVERIRPIAAPLCRRFAHMGPLGAGQTTKLCNQVVVASTFVVLAEMFGLAKAAGVNVDALPDVLEGGFADSRLMRVFGKRMTGRDFALRSRCNVMLKDLRLIADLQAATTAGLPMTAAAGEIWRMHVARGYGDEDTTTLVKLFDHENRA